MKRFLVLCALSLLLPIASRAAPPVFIGEVAWAGSNASTADEWLEVCGPAGTDLSGWTIEGAGTGNSALALPSGSLIPARGAFVISNDAADDAKSTLAAAPDWVTTAVALSNSALFLTLRDAGGTEVDHAGVAGGAPPAGTSGAIKASMERVLPLEDGGLAAAWASASTSVGFDAGATELGTPGACPSPADAPLPDAGPLPGADAATAAGSATGTAPAASDLPVETATDTPIAASAAAPTPAAPAPEPSVAAVRISEAYPAPNPGEHEWIELTDPSDVGQDLDGWTLEDGKGGATALSGMLLPWSRAVIVSPKGQLNNDGDAIVLKDASGRVIDGVAYGDWDSPYPNVGEVRKGESLIRLELQDTFAVTSTPTQGGANILTAPTRNAAPAQKTAPSTVAPDTATVPAAIPAKPAATVPAIAEQTKPQTVSAAAAKTATARKPASARYKGAGYVGIVASPPGVYSKTRLFALIDGAVRDVHLSKAPVAALAVGARIAFVAQEKSDGSDPYLLANPNSIRTLDASASATFATTETWPDQAGAYRLNAEVVSMQSGVLEAKLGGVEGDVLAPAPLTASLKAGDIVTVEGYVSPGPRPRAVLASQGALTLFKAYQAEAPAKETPAKMPWQAVAALTLLTALVGLYAYLRHQRLQRLALVLTPVDKDEETW